MIDMGTYLLVNTMSMLTKLHSVRMTTVVLMDKKATHETYFTHLSCFADKDQIGESPTSR